MKVKKNVGDALRFYSLLGIFTCEPIVISHVKATSYCSENPRGNWTYRIESSSEAQAIYLLLKD